MSRVLLWIVSGLLFLLAAVSGAASFATLTYLADPGTLSTALAPIAGPAQSMALVVDIKDTTATVNGLTLPGRPSLRITSDTVITAGAAPVEQADAALIGVPYDAVSLDDGEWTMSSVPGNADTFLTKAPWMTSGRTVSVSPEPGTALVIANADGSAPVRVTMSLELPSDFAPTLVIGLAVLAVLLLALAIAVGAIALGGTALGGSALAGTRHARPDMVT